jgi:hypothetical protein
MTRKIISIGLLGFCISFLGCNKANTTGGVIDFSKLEQDIIDDFVTQQFHNLKIWLALQPI